MSTTQPTRIGIVGYGNLGKGVELAISQNKDLQLVAIFTRRSPDQLSSKARIESVDKIVSFKGEIDVMILCGGSAKDLPEQSISISTHFNTVDSYDNHGKVPEYFAAVDKNAKAHHHLSLISTGWDPGLFSMARLLGQSVLPSGEDYTFWGKGLSQGHSDAIRKVPGVKQGVQYTLPNEEAMKSVRAGNRPELSKSARHDRVCYVVPTEDADKAALEKTIKTMPNYFAPYHTEVHFITEEAFLKDHAKMPHGGVVFRAGESAKGAKQRIEFTLDLESNPEFTSSVLVAFARAVNKMSHQGQSGAISVFDVPLGYLSPQSAAALRKELL